MYVCLCVILGYLLVACRLLESARVAAFLASPAINVVTCSEKTNGCGGVCLELAHSPGNSTFKHVFVRKKNMKKRWKIRTTARCDVSLH